MSQTRYDSKKKTSAYAVQQIKASAGSGKTHSLINILLTLLSRQDKSVQESFASMLAITFTNAAASEMKAKLIARLKTIALGLETFPSTVSSFQKKAHILIEELIIHYSSLNIRTIDSFLFMLVRQNSLLVNLPPNFEPLFNPHDFFKPLLDELAFLALATEHEEASEMRLLLPLYDKMYHSLFYTKAQNGFLGLNFVRDSIIDMCALLENLSIEEIQNLSSHECLIQKYREAQTQFSNKLNELEQYIKEHKVAVKREYLDAVELFNTKKKLDTFFLSSEFPEQICAQRSSAKIKEEGLILVKNLDQEVKEQIQEYAQKLAEKAQRAFLLRSATHYSALLDFCKIILGLQSSEEFQKAKVLSKRIVSILRENLQDPSFLPAVLENLPYQLEFMLIDEFQDTSDEQWAVLSTFVQEIISSSSFASPNILDTQSNQELAAFTYVGDIKQAIYSWRGGSSSLFEGITKDFGDNIQRINLEHNWRSAQNIIDFNNTIFRQLRDNTIFCNGEKFDIARYFLDAELDNTLAQKLTQEIQEVFSNVEQKYPKEKTQNSKKGRVVLHQLNIQGNTKDDLYDTLRPSFIETIRMRTQDYEYKDMAILTRTNTECEVYAQWLTEAGIPVITEGALNLSGNNLVRQCISFLEVMKKPQDTLALWHIVGIQGLFETVLSEKDFEYMPMKEDSSLYQRKPLWDILQDKLPDTFNLLQEFLKKSCKKSLYALLCELIQTTQVFARFPKESGFIARLLEIVFKAQTKNIFTLHSFLEYWEEEGKSEKLPMPENVNAVQIRTIHKAKGAEYKFVFIWDEFKKPKNTKSLAYYPLEDIRFIADYSRYCNSYAEDAKVKVMEVLNLLYVGYTRAKEELHIFYKTSAKKDSALEALLNPYTSSQSNTKERAHISSCFGEPLDTETLDKNIQENKGKKTLLHSKTKEKENENTFPLSYRMPQLNFGKLAEKPFLTSSVRGTIIHSFFELYFKFPHIAELKDKELSAFIGKFTFSALKEKDIPFFFADSSGTDNNLESIQKEMQKDIEGFVAYIKSLPQYSSSQALSEQNIVDASGTLLRCDLCVIKEEEIEIVDFKTGNPDFEYISQIKKYMKAFSAKSEFKNKKIKGTLVYLDLKKIENIGVEEC